MDEQELMKFYDDLAAVLESVTEMTEIDRQEFVAESFGIPSEGLHRFIAEFVRLDCMLRISTGGLPYPNPDDQISLCYKSFVFGLVFARRELTKNEAG